MPETTRGSPLRGTGSETPDGRVYLLAHRGGRGPWRENTIDAFLGAFEQGADGVELDVRRTRDGALVINHDPVVPCFGPLHELGCDELPAWMPTLEEALAACAGAFVNVEVKNSPRDPGHDPDETVALQVLEELAKVRTGRPGHASAGFLVSSFSSTTIAALVSAGAEVPLGLLVEPGRDAYETLEQAAALGCRTLNVFHLQVTPGLVEDARRTGMGVVAWTVNEPDHVASMLDAGVEMIISDDVTGALRATRAADPARGPGARATEGGLVRDGSPRGQSMP